MYRVEMDIPVNIDDLTAEAFGKILSEVLTEEEVLELINKLKKEE